MANPKNLPQDPKAPGTYGPFTMVAVGLSNIGRTVLNTDAEHAFFQLRDGKDGEPFYVHVSRFQTLTFTKEPEFSEEALLRLGGARDDAKTDRLSSMPQWDTHHLARNEWEHWDTQWECRDKIQRSDDEEIT